jgi:hypothetical protein
MMVRNSRPRRVRMGVVMRSTSARGIRVMVVVVRIASTGTRRMRVVVGVLACAGRPVMMVRCRAGGGNRQVLLIAGELGRHGRNVSCERSDDRHGELHVGSVDKNPLKEGTAREVAGYAGGSTKIIDRGYDECEVERAERYCPI